MRYMRAQISGIFLTHICTKGELPAVKCINGFPEGTKFAYAIPDIHYGIWIIIEHESFRELQDGELIPIFDPKPEFVKL